MKHPAGVAKYSQSQDCTYSNRHLSNRYCCMYSLELLMMDGKTVRNM